MATFTLTLFMVICILLIVVVLLQKGRGGGLGGALGGGMTSSAFGTRTGDVFTWVTIVLTGLFLLLAIVNTVLHRPKESLDYRPVFGPPESTIDKDTLVTITATGRMTPDQKIYYTLDGSEPTVNSSRYRKDLLVKPGQTLKAAVWRKGKLGPVGTAHYLRPGETREPSPPPTAATEPGASATAPASGPAVTPSFTLDSNRPLVDPNALRDLLLDANAVPRPPDSNAAGSPAASMPAP